MQRRLARPMSRVRCAHRGELARRSRRLLARQASAQDFMHRLAACSSVRWDRSVLPEAISRVAVVSERVVSATSPTIVDIVSGSPVR
jgi:hypothetical protein